MFVKCALINSYNCTRNRITNWQLQQIKEQYIITVISKEQNTIQTVVTVL